jgi:hypothetical protein
MSLQWNYAAGINLATDPGTGNFSIHIPDGYINPTFFQFNKTDNNGQNAVSLLTTLLGKPSFYISVDSQNYIVVNFDGIGDYGAFYRFHVNSVISIVGSLTSTVYISDEPPTNGGGGGDGGGETETEVTWVVVGDFSNKVANSTDSGRSWSQIAPIIPLEKALCGKKGGSLIIIGGEATTTGSSLYSVTSLGDTWTDVKIGLTKCNSVNYNGSQWIAVGKGYKDTDCVYLSDDGIEWTLQENIYLTEALNSYWMNNTWIVVGKCQILGYSCAYIKANKYWIGIDTVSTIYENFNFDTIKSLVKYGNDIIFIGQLDGQQRSGRITWETEPTYSTLTTDPTYGDVKYNGTYLLSFNYANNKFMVSTNGSTWTIKDDIVGSEIPASNLLIAKSVDQPSQTLDMNLINSFFTTYSLFIDRNPYSLENVNTLYSILKGVGQKCLDYYNEAVTLKTEIQDLKTNLNTLYDEIDTYLQKGLPTEIINVNSQRTDSRSALDTLEASWGLPVFGSGLDFDTSGKSYTYVTSLATYNDFLQSYTLNGQLVIDDNTVTALNTFMTTVVDHLDTTKNYQKSLKDYIDLLNTRDTLYKTNYESPIVNFNNTAISYLDSITTKFNRIEEIKTLLEDYVTLVPQTYSDAKQSFSELNFNLTDQFNAPNDYGTPLVNHHPWVYNLLKLNLVEFDYSFNYEVEGVTTVDVKHQLESQLDNYATTIYNTFPSTVFDKDSVDPVFSEINTLYTEVETLKADSTTKKSDILALYDFETIQTTREDEIISYDTYTVISTQYNIVTKLDDYITRDQTQLTDLETNIQDCQSIINQRNSDRIAAYNALIQSQIDQQTAVAAAETAFQEYQQSDEARVAQEALLKQLQDQQAAANVIAEQQVAVQIAQEQAAAKLLLQQQADLAQQLAETQRANDEAFYLASINATKAYNEAKAAREAEATRLAAINPVITEYDAFRLSRARILYYVYFNGLSSDATGSSQDNISYNLFKEIESDTLANQFLENAKSIYNFIRTGFDIHENYIKGELTVDHVNSAKIAYEFDFESTKNSIIRLYNIFNTAKLNIQGYINSIDLTTEFVNLKLINNTNGTSVETKYNQIKDALLDELDNIVEVSDLTLTISEGVTIGSDGNTPLKSVSFSDQSLFNSNVTTNIPIGNLSSAKNIHAFLIEFNTYIKLIKLVSNTKIYVDDKYSELTASRVKILSDISDIVDVTNATSIATLFDPLINNVSSMLNTLNNITIFTTITNSSNLQGINTNFDLLNFSTYYPTLFQTREKNIKVLATVRCDDSDILLNTTILRELGDYFYNTIFNLNSRVIKLRDGSVTPSYNNLNSTRTAIISLFNPYGISTPLQIDSLYNKYLRYNIYSQPDFKAILDFTYNILLVSVKQSDYQIEKNNYYTAYAGCIDNNVIPYPDATDSQNSIGSAFTFWIDSRTYYNNIQIFLKNFGDSVQTFLDSFSIIKIREYLGNVDTLENEWITTVDSNYITNIETVDNATLLASYKSNAINYISSVLKTLPIAIFPSNEDITKFKLQGVSNDIKNKVNVLKTYSTQTFSNSNINQIISSITYFKILIISLSTTISSLTSKIEKINDYKNKVQELTDNVSLLKDAIDRKENIVSNYLNGSTPVTLEMYDGTAKSFIMSIKPTNTNFWEEVVDEDELDYTLFDSNWRYYVGDKVSYNKKVYRLKNAVPTRTYEDDLLLKGNLPTFPKTDSSSVFFTQNTDYWTFIEGYQVNSGIPTLNELRSYNGDLYKCINVFRDEETVTIPPKDSIHWKFIPTADYVVEGAIQYYDSQEQYTEDEEVLFKYQLSSLTSAQPYRLDKFRAVKTVSENFPRRFIYPRVEIGSTLNPTNAYIDPDTNQPVSNTIPYQNTLVDGNQVTTIPRYGIDDPWRIEGLFRDLRYSIALGPEMAILYAFRIRSNIRDTFYSGNTVIADPVGGSALNSENIPDDATTVLNNLVSSFDTQFNRLNDGISNSNSERVRRNIQAIYNKAYDSIFYILDKYIQDITFLVNRRNVMKQNLFNVYQSYIEDNLSDFLDSGLSTENNYVFRDLEVGNQDSVFYEYYNTYKDEYEIIKDKLEYYLDSINRTLGLDLVEFGITKNGAVSMGAGIESTSSYSNSFFPNYQPIGITDWRYIENSQYVDDAELDQTTFPIMSRVKRIVALLATKPRYINDTQQYIPTTDPAILGLYKVTLGLAIIGNAFTSEIFDISSVPGNTNPVQQAAQNNRKMKEFVRTIQDNAKSVTSSTIITNEFLTSIEVIEDNVKDLEDNLDNLRDVNKGVQTVPNEITVGSPPVSTSGTIPLPSRPDNPKLLQLIDSNEDQLNKAKKALDDAKKALEEYKRLGETKPVISKPAIEIVQESRVPPRKSWANTIKNETYIRSAGEGNITTKGKERTRIFGSNGQPIPDQTTKINQSVANAVEIEESTSKIISDSEVAMNEEIARRKEEFDAQITEQERNARQNAEINLKNSETMRQYEADIQKYNEDFKKASEARRKARIEFQRADTDYRDALRAQSERLEDIKVIKERNARILAQNQSALEEAENALKNAKAVQSSHATTVLNNMNVQTVTRSLIVTNYIRNLRIVQFLNTKVISKVASGLSRAYVGIASSAAGRLSARLAGSTAARLAGGFLGPAVNMGIGFYTAFNEGLFDD